MARVDRKAERVRRHERLRRHLAGTADRPRLVVFRSLHHIYAQVIDDSEGRTLVSAGTVEDAVREGLDSTRNREAARKVGELIAARAQEKGIKQVVFDRGGNTYHGRVAALADGARSGGLEF
ncbi:MAG: 50S ribosomal protein L18 [Limnochordia bacterium]|jgi:large subunit ribosomal protein L18